MRLSEPQTRIVLDLVRQEAGNDVSVLLYGSRTDDSRRGGDVDLLIESEPPIGLWQCARIKTRLEQALQLPVDIVAKARNAAPTPFQSIALATAHPLVWPQT